MAGYYEATQDKKVRKLPSRTISLNEDEVLKQRERRLLKTTIDDQRRNIPLVAWMIRTHLAYAVDMTFQAVTRDESFNAELEAWVADQSHAHNFDIRGLVNARQGFRLLESGALVGGDNFLLKIAQGPGLIQGLESDRICTPVGGQLPERFRSMKISHGVIRRKDGKPRWYVICKRDRMMMVFDKMVRANDMIEHTFVQRWDQGRGVSPLAAAVTLVQDYHEAQVYAALKAKLSHVLGFTLIRDAGEGESGFLARRQDGSADTDLDANTSRSSDESPSTVTEHDIKFGKGGPEWIDLNPGEKVEPIETNHPSFEYQEFTDVEVRAIMLALNFPWTFFDARKGSYTIQRADKNRYVRAVVPDRERNMQTRNRWLLWKLDRAVNELGTFKLPRGWTIEDVKWIWNPGAEVWLDALKEVMASVVAIRMCLTSPQRICNERGLNWFRVREECREAFHWMIKNDLPVQEWSAEFDEKLAEQLALSPENQSGGSDE
jgi:capsid protein